MVFKKSFDVLLCLTTLALRELPILHTGVSGGRDCVKPQWHGVQRKSDGSHKVLRVLDIARHSVPSKLKVPELDTQ